MYVYLKENYESIKVCIMKNSNFIKTSVLIFALTLGQSFSAQKTKMVGAAAMYPSKNIIENAVNSKDHTTLIAADLVSVCQVTDLLPFLHQ